MAFLVFVLSLIWFFLMYKFYGGFISKKVFKLNPRRKTPAHEFNDGVDYVPTNKWVVWGHHFTSIAGLGPIVGPAIAIIWGWVPAVLWITLGTIFLGAVHDFAALVISLRNKGKSIGELTTEIIGKRAKYLFMSIIFFELWIVIAIFAMIMGILFSMYPEAVLPVWLEIPIAIALSYMVFVKKKSLHTWSWIALLLMYATIAIGVFTPIQIPGSHAVEIWLVILMIYAFIASTLPVETLLQPRDYINSHELLVAMGLVFLGALVALFRDPGHLNFVAPAFNSTPEGAPPIWPFLFVTIACGAISGFHTLVSSGTSSKQIDKEPDAKLVGYGGMVAEGILASLVVLAVAAGFGATGNGLQHGIQAWNEHYASWQSAAGLGAKIGAFVEGSVNMMAYMFGHSKYIMGLMTTIMGVFIVSFAGTTLDSATRVQRYILQEIGKDTKQKWLTNKYAATFVAVFSAFLLAMIKPGGKGALILWPLFGTVNQLLAALALLVATVYLARKKSNPYIAGIPMIFMVIMTAWAMYKNILNYQSTGNTLLFVIGTIVFILMIWLIIEAIIVLKKVKAGTLKSEEFN
ncbi:MAG: carbon starvation protein A [Thermosipho sp. (in: Bacteria)]|nr:carbon starvation protein A [Thermosipho sp. (in: thermotogales)]